MLLIIILFCSASHICAHPFECQCLNGGICTYLNTTCECPEEWEGTSCEIALCDDWFCLHGGKCQFPNVNCSCTEGWTGNRCSIRDNFNHILIIYICIGVTFLMNFIVALAVCLGVICYVRSRNQKSNSNRERDELWMEATSRRCQLDEVIREAGTRLKDIQGKKHDSQDNLKRKSAVQETLVKTEIKPELKAPGTGEASSTRKAQSIIEISRDISLEVKRKSAFEMKNLKLNDTAHSRLSTEILAAAKTRNSDCECSSKDILTHGKEKAGKKGIHCSKQPKDESKPSSASSTGEPSSEEYYTVPDNMQTSAGSEISHHSIQKVANIAYSSQDKLQHCGTKKITSTPNIAYRALQQQTKASSSNTSTDNGPEINIYKV